MYMLCRYVFIFPIIYNSIFHFHKKLDPWKTEIYISIFTNQAIF